MNNITSFLRGSLDGVLAVPEFPVRMYNKLKTANEESAITLSRIDEIFAHPINTELVSNVKSLAYIIGMVAGAHFCYEALQGENTKYLMAAIPAIEIISDLVFPKYKNSQ